MNSPTRVLLIAVMFLAGEKDESLGETRQLPLSSRHSVTWLTIVLFAKLTLKASPLQLASENADGFEALDENLCSSRDISWRELSSPCRPH
ncbi:MAG: hypothetical protein L0338_15375 [Acidobacteria bacterium]|nr:hypothetical protein [Acidobacteriota bacterium]